MRMSLRLLSPGFGLVVMLALLPLPASAQSDPAHKQANSEKPQPWPGGVIPCFFHEHERWDRDQCVTIHYENIKPGRAPDYDWIPKANWIVSSLPYDYHSIMHYRICWTSKCESECKDGVGSSPCAVIEPVDKQYDGVIGQWTENGISALDAERVRLVYGTR
jgi:hypothetical protein